MNKKDNYKEKIFLEEYYKKQHNKLKKAKPTKYNEKPTVNHTRITDTSTLTNFKIKH